MKNEWALAVSGSGSGAVIDGVSGGIYRLSVANVAGDTASIQWNDIRPLIYTKNPCMETRISKNTNLDVTYYLAMTYDSTHRIIIYGNGFGTTYTNDGAGPTTAVSGFTSDTNFHVYRIQEHILAANHVHFYQDGAESSGGSLNTNVCVSYMQPWFMAARTAAAGAMDLDYVAVRQDR